jgi:hypothetical protein
MRARVMAYGREDVVEIPSPWNNRNCPREVKEKKERKRATTYEKKPVEAGLGEGQSKSRGEKKEKKKSARRRRLCNLG